jgi:ABC-type nitrate/sulfonate/bicarbonate transport system substrate-binding protein
MRAWWRSGAWTLGLAALTLGIVSCQPAAPSRPGAPAGAATASPAAARPAPAQAAEAAQSGAATPAAPLPVRIVHSTRNGSQAIAQVLVDSGPLTENGLVGSLLHVDGPARAIAVLLTGEADVALMGGETALAAAVEGAELTVVGGFLNRRDHVLFAQPEVASLAELRGKRIGVNGIGAADHRAIAEVFQHFRLDPQDATFVVIAGGPANRLGAMQSGAADATGLQPPLTGRARQLGLRELVQIGQIVERPVPANAVVASRAAVAERPDLCRRFLRAVVQGVHLYQAQPEAVLRANAAFFDVDLNAHRADLEDTRAHYAALFPPLPLAPLDGYALALEELAETTPRAAGYRLSELIDNRFVEEIEASGLIQRLYGR